MIKELWEMTKEELVYERDTAELELQDLESEIDGIGDRIRRIEYELLRRKDLLKTGAR